MQFYILYQNSIEVTYNQLSFAKYYNDATVWQTLKRLKQDNYTIHVIKMYEV